MKRIYILFILCILSFCICAQTLNNNSEAVPFLSIAPDARSAGMGDVGTALSPDAFSFWHNAAVTVFSEEQGAIAYSYTSWMREWGAGCALNSLGGFYKIDTKQSVVAGFRNFSHQDMEISDENGNILGKFTPKDWALDLGYSRLLIKDLSMSLSLRYIHSDMGSYNGAAAGNAVAFDLGFYYRRRAALLDSATWSVGVQVANIGSKIKYLDTKYDLPGKLNIGGAIHLPFSQRHVLNCALDLNYQMMPAGSSSFQAGIGAEYVCMKYAIIRGGYHFGDKDKGYDSYGTLGCGVRFYHIQGDFSYLLAKSDSLLKNTLRFTVGIDFGLFWKKAQG
ncbi:PorV/PorQ family protein [Odoribacter lunatus]|uniref:PorV/PorQ family protein n=1 Tax=Odoribacter lunatus TaxID=2941335 RepID=UPI00203FBBC2|nr:PorV/PorQ family protein [Odoribacter lunatus]